MRRASVGEVAVLEAVFEGALRAGGGMGEVMGEARVWSLVGDAGKAAVGESGAQARRAAAWRTAARK